MDDMDDMDEWVEKMAATYQRVRQLQDLGQNEEGLALGLTLIEPTRRVLGEVTEDMAEVCATVGILARRAGRLDLAVEHQRRALEIRIALFGNRDLSVAASLSNLGTVYLEAQSFPEAESCYRQALEIKEQLPDGDLLGLAFTRNNLASVLALNGDRAGAEQLLLTAVAEAERAEAADWRTVHILSNLARTYWGVKRLADAAPVIERALEIGRQVLPPGHYLLLDQRDLLGQCLLGLGRSAEATAVLAEAAQDHLDQFGADDVPDHQRIYPSVPGLPAERSP